MARAKRVDNKGRVLRVGESQNKDGRYCYKWTDNSGKRSAVYALTLKELREKEEQIKRDQMDGIYIKGGALTLNEFFRLFMGTKKNIRDSTRCNYESYWKNAIAPSTLGKIKISQIKQIHVKRLYADLLEKGYSPGTIRAYHIILSECLQTAGVPESGWDWLQIPYSAIEDRDRRKRHSINKDCKKGSDEAEGV